MKTVTVTLESTSPYSQSAHHQTPKLDKELDHDYEVRTWRERIHATEDGHIFIPPMCFRNCIASAAQYLTKKIPGKRNETYTKHFRSGILVTEGLILSEHKDTVPGEWLFVPADGKTGGSKRVSKCFCVVHSWGGKVVFYVLDEVITKDPFAEILQAGGNFIGVGRFRPERNGYYGRFKVLDIEWK